MILQAMPYPAEGGGGAWAPDQLASLYGWYDPTSQSEANGAEVGTMVDQSGNGRNWPAHASGNAGAPLMETGAVNGLSAFDFANSAGGKQRGFVLSNTFLPNASTTAAAFFALVKHNSPTSTPSFNDGHLISGIGGNTNAHSPYQASARTYEWFGGSSRRDNITVATAAEWGAWGIWAVVAKANDQRMFFNGSQRISYTSHTFTTGASQRTVGFRGADGGVRWLGKCAELVFLNALPSNDDIDKMFGYMAHRAGIASVLPSGHPYKASPPA